MFIMFYENYGLSVPIETRKGIVLPRISYSVIIFDEGLFVCTSLSLIWFLP